MGVLIVGVGAVMGGSRKLVLTLETNILRLDDISFLIERMNRVLTAAVMVSTAGSDERNYQVG